jgi:hypothetical protein
MDAVDDPPQLQEISANSVDLATHIFQHCSNVLNNVLLSLPTLQGLNLITINFT